MLDDTILSPYEIRARTSEMSDFFRNSNDRAFRAARLVLRAVDSLSVLRLCKPDMTTLWRIDAEFTTVQAKCQFLQVGENSSNVAESE